MTGELVRFPASSSGISSEVAHDSARRFLALPLCERLGLAGELHIGQPETLLALCQMLDENMAGAPAKTAEDSEWIYDFLRADPGAHSFLFDEREYYLGEIALLAGVAARAIGQRDDARKWFDRSEGWFLLTVNIGGDIARVGYQRLALKMEERQFAEVRELVPPLREAFTRSGAKEHALKCRYLEAAALRETDQLSEALVAFEEIVEEAKSIGSSKVLEPALVTIIQIYSEFGEADKVMALASEAAPILRMSNNRVMLAKLQWGVANLLRKQGRLQDSIEALRTAQQEFREIGLRSDVAALHLVLGDLLLETGQERQAEWEIRAALPVIDELKMVPEGFAAMSLLRESLRRRSIDRGALRKLHGYFDEIRS